MPDYNRTAYYLNREAVRLAMLEEIGIRGVSYTEIAEETGVQAAGIGRFMDPTKNASLSGDALITLIKWMGRGNVDQYVARRRSVRRHVDTFEQRKLRTGSAFVKSLGVEADSGETSVDVLMRLVAKARENGFLG